MQSIIEDHQHKTRQSTCIDGLVIMSIRENEDTTKEALVCLINYTELTCASSVLSSINRWRNVSVIVVVLDIFVQSVRDRDYVILRRLRIGIRVRLTK